MAPLGHYCCFFTFIFFFIMLVMIWFAKKLKGTQTVSKEHTYVFSFTVENQELTVCVILFHTLSPSLCPFLPLSLSFALGLSVSHGGLNHSHITPNTSLGLISATPSRGLPSPTVNTREALGMSTPSTCRARLSHSTCRTHVVKVNNYHLCVAVSFLRVVDLIGNMFQGPTLLQDPPFNNTHNTATEENGFERNRVAGVCERESSIFTSVYDFTLFGSNAVLIICFVCACTLLSECSILSTF